MASLFISYSRRDIETARKLTEAFQGQELDFWIDWEGIDPTVDWWREIEKGIEQADNFLFLISPDSARSPVCKQEIEHAVRNGKRLIPVVVRETQTGEVASELRPLNWIFLRAQDDFHLAFAKLITAIKTDYAWVQFHRRLLVKALEWQRSTHENSLLLRGKDLQDAELQLATNATKLPHPTDLQREYVLRSRQASDRQRRITMSIAVAGVIALAALAIFGFVQAGLANERATISRAQELAAQSLALRDTNFPVSLLLGVEAFQVRDTVQTRGALMDNVQANPKLGAYLNGHTRWINSVAFSPDGKMLASGGGDSTIILWDVATRQPIGEPLIGHTDWIRSLAFSPNGKMLASGSNDSTIILWDVQTKQPIGQPLKGHTDVITGIAFSPDGKLLASGSADGTLILWDMQTRQPIGAPLRGHTSWISSIAISPDGKTLASGSEDQTIILWDMEAGKAAGPPLDKHSGMIISLAFSPDGKTLASANEDSTVILWQVNTGQPIGQPLRGQTGLVESVVFSPDGKILASSSTDRTIVLWDVGTRQPIGQPLRGHTDLISSIAFSPDGKTLASGSNDNAVILWDVSAVLSPQLEEAGAVRQTLESHTGAVSSLAFSPDAKKPLLASGGNDSTITLWDLKTRQPLHPPLSGHNQGISGIAFTQDGKTLASGGRDGTILLWDIPTLLNPALEAGQAIPRVMGGKSGAVTALALSPDGKILAAALKNHSIILWDVPGGQPIGQPLSGHTEWAGSLAFSPDGKLLASGSYDTTLLLWDVSDPLNTKVERQQPLAQLMKDYHGSVSSLVFSPDGKTLASGHGDGVVILWNTETREPLGQPLSGHTGFVDSLAFTPDGKTLASGSGDSTVILWDVDRR